MQTKKFRIIVAMLLVLFLLVTPVMPAVVLGNTRVSETTATEARAPRTAGQTSALRTTANSSGATIVNSNGATVSTQASDTPSGQIFTPVTAAPLEPTVSAAVAASAMSTVPAAPTAAPTPSPVEPAATEAPTTALATTAPSATAAEPAPSSTETAADTASATSSAPPVKATEVETTAATSPTPSSTETVATTKGQATVTTAPTTSSAKTTPSSIEPETTRASTDSAAPTAPATTETLPVHTSEATTGPQPTQTASEKAPQAVRDDLSLLSAETTFTYERVTVSGVNGIRITGFQPGQETAELVIPDTIEGLPVLAIGDRAFMQADLTRLTLGANLVSIEPYAFANNRLSALALNNALQEIGEFAFRDNQLTSLHTNQVKTLNSGAFINNQLTSLTLPVLQTVGNDVFKNNLLKEVTVPTTVTAFGQEVFAYNNRYVLVHTDNARIKTEIVAGGFGHVVNPVTVTINFLDQATGQPILNSQTWGDDLTQLDGVVAIGVENVYEPPAISGFTAIESPVRFTPTTTTHLLDVYYRSTAGKPTLELVQNPLIAPNGDGSREVLLSFVKATDLDGRDISDRIQIDPETIGPDGIDTSVPGSVSVGYRVSDDYGNTTVRTFQIMVGTEWMTFPLGNGWTLGDFTYDKNKVTGFSASGLEKVQREKNLILPHLNPYDGTTVIDTVAKNNANPPAGPVNFFRQGLTSVTDFADNIKVIEGDYDAASAANRTGFVFSENNISSIKLDALEYAGNNAFSRNLPLTQVSFPNLVFLGASALARNSLTSVDLPRVEYVDTWGLGTNNLTDLTLPRLKETNMAAFISNKIATVSLPELVSTGANTFANNRLTAVTPENFPKLAQPGSGSFRDNQITRVELPQVTRLANNAFGYNAVTTVIMPALEVIDTYAFRANQLTELTLPSLKTINPDAFVNNPGSPAYGGNVVIWADDQSIPSRENYVVNPYEETESGVWVEADFTWDQHDPGRVTGLSPSGKIKLASLNYEIILPPRAVTVGSLAFNKLQLNAVSGAEVVAIEARAFENNRLTAADFPKVQTVGDSAFATNSLTRFNFESLTHVATRAFYNNPITGEVNLAQVTVIGDEAFYVTTAANRLITAVEAPVVTDIGLRAFARQPVEQISFPQVQTVAAEAFFQSRLSSLHLPAVQTIGGAAFAANRLTDIVLPEVQELGAASFAGNLLTRLELPNIETLAAGDYRSPGSNTLLAAGGVFNNNRITEAYLPLTLTALPPETFKDNRNHNATRQAVMVFLPGGQNPQGLGDGYLNQVLQHLVNPTKVTVSFVDAAGAALAESFTEYIFAGKTYSPVRIFDYEPRQDSITVPDDRQIHQVEFVYDRQGLSDKQTEGVEIYQENQIDANTQLKKTRYLIGTEMVTKVYVDCTGFDNTIDNARIRVYYDVRYIDESSITIPAADSIIGYTVNNGVIELEMDPIASGYSSEIPITWKFKEKVTPNNYRMEIHALVADGDEVLSVAKPIHVEGYYNPPTMSKRSPLNIPGYDYGGMTSATNGPRLMGEMDKILLADKTYLYAVTTPYPVEYSFTIERLERYVSQARVVEVLPTYIAINEAGEEEVRTAVFKAESNPAWDLQDDGVTLIQDAGFAPTLYPGNYIKPLLLEFPGLKSGHNVQNRVSVELTPSQQGLHEETLMVRDDLSVYAVKYEPIKYDGDPRFDKDDARRPRFDGTTSYFYDTQIDREKVIPFLLRVSSLAEKSDLVDVRITDYDLDPRLYYYGLSFVRGSLPVTVNAYKQAGAKMNPASDTLLQSVSTMMMASNNVVFNPNIARDIDYVQIVLPKDHKVHSALEFNIDTKLREPDRAHYNPAPHAADNVFENHAVMSGNLYLKGTRTPASERTEPLTGPGGLIISQYSEAWDNIPGNYLWHEQAIVNIRDYKASMGVGKSQTFPSDRVVYPGAKGTYQVRLRPFTLGGQDESEGRSVVREELLDFKMVDLLPKGLSVLNVTLSEGFRDSQESGWQLVDNYNNVPGQRALIFAAKVLQAGVFDIASIEVEIEPDTDEGQVTNKVFATWTPNAGVVPVGTQEKPPGHASDDDIWLVDQVSFNLLKVNELFARKYIKRAADSTWSSTGIVTESGGAFDYRLSVINSLQSARNQVVLVDFFPYVGDVSIQEMNVGTGVRPPRESEFRNSFDLTREVIVPAGYDVYYWNSDSDIDYAGKSADAVIRELTWSAAPAANTRGIKIEAQAGVQLAANSRLDVIIPLRAPANTIDNNFDLTGKRAYNTFVRKDSETLRFLEPNRVYNEIEAPRGSIELTKWAQESFVDDPVNNPRYTLAGAVFELRDQAGNFVGRGTSDADGRIVFDNLPIAHDYTLKEVAAPEGYQLVQTTYTVTFEDFKNAYDPVDGSFVVRLSNQDCQEHFLNIKPLYGSLELDKINENGTRLPYIPFRLQGLSDWNQDYDRTFYTNANGYLKVDRLIEGQYRLSEIVADGVSGFVPIDPIEFTIQKGQLTHRHLVADENPVINREVVVYINKLAVGSDFELAESIQDLTDFGRAKLDGYSFTISPVADPAASVTVGPTVDGRIGVTGLPLNTLLRISEVKKEGKSIYLHNDQSYEFMINELAKITDRDGKPFRQNVLNIPNPEKPIQGLVKVAKSDAAGRPLAGAVFGLFQEGRQIAEATSVLTGGKAIAEFTELPPGTYVIKEVAAPSGYVRSTQEYAFTVPDRPNPQMLSNPQYHIHDDRIVREFNPEYLNHKFQVIVAKGDDVRTNIPLAEAQAMVANDATLAWRRVGADRASVYRKLSGAVFELRKITATGFERLGDYASNQDGQVDFDGFAFEEDTVYHLVETQAAPGYVLDSRPLVIDTGFEANLEGFTGEIRRYKNNVPLRGRVIISKYDEDDRVVLPGVTFSIYRADDVDFAAPLETLVTDDTGLLEFSNLVPGDYVVREEAVPAGYQHLELLRNVTVTEEATNIKLVVNNPQLVAFDVIKKWVGPPLAEVTVVVLADGQTAYDVDGRELLPVQLQAANDWTARFSNLPKYSADGNLITYTVQETPVEQYQTMVIGTQQAGFTVINTALGRLSIGVTKVWEGEPLEQVTVYLLADGKRTQQQIVLHPGNRWQHVFEDLPATRVNDAGETEPIAYTVEEEAVAGYTTTYTGDATEGFTIINRADPQTEVQVTKIWQGTPQNAVTVQLLADARLIDTASLSADSDWTWTFGNLPVYREDGVTEIVYTISEVALAGYVSEITGDAATGFVITNTEMPPPEPTPPPTTPTPTPTPAPTPPATTPPPEPLPTPPTATPPPAPEPTPPTATPPPAPEPTPPTATPPPTPQPTPPTATIPPAPAPTTPVATPTPSPAPTTPAVTTPATPSAPGPSVSKPPTAPTPEAVQPTPSGTDPVAPPRTGEAKPPVKGAMLLILLAVGLLIGRRVRRRRRRNNAT